MAKPHKHRNKWRIRWKDHLGKRRSAVFGDYHEARREQCARQAEVDAIVAGTKPAPPPDATFGELCDFWLKVKTPQKKKARDDQSIIRCHLRPAFGALPLKSLGFAHVESFKVAKGHLSNKTVYNLLTLLGAMLRYAIKLGWLVKMPVIERPRVRVHGAEYSYLKSNEEVCRFLHAARRDGEDAYMLYATAFFTGLRQGELAGLRWAAVRFEDRLIVVERSFESTTKAEDVRYVPILDDLLPLLREWRLKTPGALVFPNGRGGMHRPSARIFQERLHRVLDAAGFERPGPGVRQVHYITFHDLRHSFASHWVKNRGDIFRLQKILGHKSIELTMRYAHLAPSEFSHDFSIFSAVGAQNQQWQVAAPTCMGIQKTKQIQTPARLPKGRVPLVEAVGRGHNWAK